MKGWRDAHGGVGVEVDGLHQDVGAEDGGDDG